MAGIELIWVDFIGAHLEFDLTIPNLELFRFPSFCNIHKTENSLIALSVFSHSFVLQHLTNIHRMSKDCYNVEERPCGFSFPNMMQEIMLSFHLLFRDDRRAYKIFQRQERAKAITSGITNRWLDELSGATRSTSMFSWGSPIRETYSAKSDFPIFARRLHRVQEYVAGIQPNRISSLWRDRRDLQRWYTIWAVLIIGGVSVLLAIAQIWLSAAQVGIASEALKLQKEGNNTHKGFS